MNDLTGQKFGRLTVIEFAGRDKHSFRLWKCKCDCGQTIIAVGSNLRSENTRSCGCFGREQRLKSRFSHGEGRPRTRAYRIWGGIIQRCTNQKNASYKNYGGRGISVCERWLSFENFKADMGEPPKDHSIDRIDNNGNYEPGNCRWATATVQRNNNRRTHPITINGVTQNFVHWVRQHGINPTLAYQRIRDGWPVELAVSVPPSQKNKYKYSKFKKAELVLDINDEAIEQEKRDEVRRN